MSPPDHRHRRAAEELTPAVYEDLRRVAQGYFRRQPSGFTLRPTEIVHEACLQLMQHGHERWRSPEEFRAVATRKIWQVIVDHVRARRSKKRGGGRRSPSAAGTHRDGEPPSSPDGVPAHPWHRVPLESITVEWPGPAVDLLDLADAMEAFAAVNARPHEVVMLHWFGGLTFAEVARQLGVSVSTVEKDSRCALAWLNRRLGGADGRGD